VSARALASGMLMVEMLVKCSAKMSDIQYNILRRVLDLLRNVMRRKRMPTFSIYNSTSSFFRRLWLMLSTMISMRFAASVRLAVTRGSCGGR
jgi:hypothetical protein